MIGLPGCEFQPEEDTRPNILFITTDYTRGVDVPAVGAPFLKMPVLDRLTEEGAVFTSHSCTAPICMPARATIVTGHYPHSHSLWDNAAIPVKKEGRPFLIRDLKERGYTTAGIGKMHFHPFEEDFHFDYRVTLEGKDLAYRDDDYERYLEKRGYSRKKIRELEGNNPGIPRGQSFFDWPLEESLHPDAFVGHKAVEAIRNNVIGAEQLWFLWVSFTGPHNPWNAPSRLARIYREMEDLPAGDFVEGELAEKPLDFTRHRYGYGGDLFDYYDHLTEKEKYKLRHDLRAAHYASLSFIDEQMAGILEELEQRELLENTLIIFTADHGSALFDNEMLHKGAPFPTQSMVPFVVWHPGRTAPGVRRHFSSHVDLYPTLMELAGQKELPSIEGRSLLPMLRDPEAGVRDFVVIESALVTSWMNENWLMGIHHLTGEVDLYNLREDPMCHYNLGSQPQQEAVLADLREQLVNWRKSKSTGEPVDEDPCQWYSELGDTLEIEKFRERYLQEYQNLTDIDDSRPGKTGEAAAEVLKQLLDAEEKAF